MEASNTDPTATPPEPPASAPPADAPPANPQAEAIAGAQAADTPQTAEEMLHTLIEAQTAQRAEIAQLRQEVATKSAPAPAVTVTILSDAEKADARMSELGQFSHYCPGCGNLCNYPRECTGSATAPHTPIEVVPTTELTSGDPNVTPTAAPASG